MPAIKARKITASNMTTPVDVEQRVWSGSAWVWQVYEQGLFCEFRSKAAKTVSTGMMTIGATYHMLYTRYQVGLVVGMRFHNQVTGTYLYVENVTDVEQVHQWMEIVAVESVFETSVTVLRPGTSRGTYGNVTESPTTIGSLPAIIGEPNATTLSVLADRVGAQEFIAVGVPVGSDVKIGDNITLLHGDTFRVHAVRQPMSFQALLTLFAGKQV